MTKKKKMTKEFLKAFMSEISDLDKDELNKITIKHFGKEMKYE